MGNNKFTIYVKKLKYHPSHGTYDVYQQERENGIALFVHEGGKWMRFANGEPECYVRAGLKIVILDDNQ